MTPGLHLKNLASNMKFTLQPPTDLPANIVVMLQNKNGTMALVEDLDSVRTLSLEDAVAMAIALG